MPAILCKCGNKIPYGQIPCPAEWLMIPDTVYDQYPGLIEAETLYKAMISALICDRCRRMWVFWDGFGAEPTPYQREDCS